jgi:hypothetical protein
MNCRLLEAAYYQECMEEEKISAVNRPIDSVEVDDDLPF